MRGSANSFSPSLQRPRASGALLQGNARQPRSLASLAGSQRRPGNKRVQPTRVTYRCFQPLHLLFLTLFLFVLNALAVRDISSA